MSTVIFEIVFIIVLTVAMIAAKELMKFFKYNKLARMMLLFSLLLISILGIWVGVISFIGPDKGNLKFLGFFNAAYIFGLAGFIRLKNEALFKF